MDFCNGTDYKSNDLAIIRHHGFYATNEMLGIPQMTDYEIREYKRLIGMPEMDSYDDLISHLGYNSPKCETNKKGHILMKVFASRNGKK